jgi:hypothetical protein
MSKKSSLWENGYQESFYGRFKFEDNLNQYPSLDTPINFRRSYFESKAWKKAI